jgi:UDP-galactopyranose mutase
MSKKYDYLIVGSGLFGAVFAFEAKKRGKNVLVVERRNHIGGNIYCREVDGINVHEYGAHIFHTSKKEVWDYVNQFVEFNHYVNSPIANFKDEIYNLPFNMNTFNKMWGISTPEEAKEIIENQRASISGTPQNLEEQAIQLVGKDIYEKLIKGYTEKQWGRDCNELPAFIIKRLPVRYTYDNNYFNDRYQGIPIGGYNVIIDKLLEGIEVHLNVDFNEQKSDLTELADKIVYTGMIDAFFGFSEGKLEYRTIRLENEKLPVVNYQGVAVVNYTDRETPYTRIIEHKHFEFGTSDSTVITREYPSEMEEGMEPFYPVNNDLNAAIYKKYEALAVNYPNIIFGGRLAEYKYYDMDKVIESALNAVKKYLN